MTNKKIINAEETQELILLLKQRFEENKQRHVNCKWDDVQIKLENNPTKLWALKKMEETGGEPDVIGYDKKSEMYIFCDCSPESPTGRRSLCYDDLALESRKTNKPKDSIINMASTLGIEVLDENQYLELQRIGTFDKKTSSWIKTPEEIRTLGGALFCDYRYNSVFVYHNGAESYYASRGFRGLLKV